MSKVMTRKDIQSVLKYERLCLEAHVVTHFYDMAHDNQVRIRLLRVILGQIDSEGNTPEDKEENK